jgi:hypothetical protein
MTKINVTIDSEALAEVIANELTWHRDDLMTSLQKDTPLVFHHDPAEDKIEILRHIDAFNLLIKFYSIPI